MTDFLDMQQLISPLIDAYTKIAVYNEKLKSTKVDHTHLLELFSVKEAVESIKIEGTQITMDEMLNYRATENKATNDILEVVNYIKALNEASKLLERYPFSGYFIKNLHKVLMSGEARGRSRVVAGEFRTIQNFLGPSGVSIENATYIPPEPQLVPDYISNLEKYINDYIMDKPLIKAALMHSQFETIHPFSDGNGRTRRILIDQVNGLYDRTVNKAKEIVHSTSMLDVIDIIFRYPIFTTARIHEYVNISNSTLNNYLNKLCENKIIFSDGAARNRKYYFYDLISIIQ